MANILAKPGWFQYVWISLVVLGLIITGYFSLDPAQTAQVGWYVKWIWAVLFILILDLVLDKLFKFSLMPSGEFNPSEYFVQASLGYNGAVIVALIGGSIFAAIFGWTIYTQGVIYFPIGAKTAMLSTTATPNLVTGLVHSIPPTFIENPLLILIEFGLIRNIMKVILRLFRMPPIVISIVSGFVAALGAAIIFPVIFHEFAYAAIEPAYWRAFIIVFLNLLIVAFTGIPLPLDLNHFTNNFFAVVLSVVGFSVAISKAKVIKASIGIFVIPKLKFLKNYMCSKIRNPYKASIHRLR